MSKVQLIHLNPQKKKILYILLIVLIVHINCVQLKLFVMEYIIIVVLEN